MDLLALIMTFQGIEEYGQALAEAIDNSEKLNLAIWIWIIVIIVVCLLLSIYLIFKIRKSKYEGDYYKKKRRKRVVK